MSIFHILQKQPLFKEPLLGINSPDFKAEPLRHVWALLIKMR
ncbi:MAG: hypothetical protein ACRCUY_10585 [Thermoguttaceae bacterium]